MADTRISGEVSNTIVITSTESDWKNSGIDWDENGRAIVLPTCVISEWVKPKYMNHSNHLNTKYPHVCFKCKRELRFIELYGINREYSEAFNIPLYKRLKKLWKSPYVEFYCCVCFNLNALNKSLGF